MHCGCRGRRTGGRYRSIRSEAPGFAQVADAIHDSLGAIFVVEAEHLCMTMRGVQKQVSVTVTSAVCGIYAS
jgi:GTP cyclohydrolase IA